MNRLLCLLFAALLLAACGGSSDRLSKSAYEAKLHAAFVAAQEADGAAHKGHSNQVQILRAVAATYNGLAKTLRGVKTPLGAQKLNDQLVTGAAAQARALDSLAAKLAATRQPASSRVLAQFDANDVPGQRQFDRAVAALEAKGYRFRPSGGT